MGNYFSKNLRYLRESKKLSQNKLAEIIGVNQTTIARWEDDNRTPNLDNAIDVSNALDIPLPDLIGKDLEKDSTEIFPSEKIEFKRILKDKGLIDENDNITEEDAEKLIQFAINNKDFLINKKEKEE